MNDAKLEQLIKPLIRIYDNIELELIKDIANRLNNYDGIKGSLKWYLDKLQEMGGFNKNNLSLIAEYSGKSQKEVREILKFAGWDSRSGCPPCPIPPPAHSSGPQKPRSSPPGAPPGPRNSRWRWPRTRL